MEGVNFVPYVQKGRFEGDVIYFSEDWQIFFPNVDFLTSGFVGTSVESLQLSSCMLWGLV